MRKPSEGNGLAIIVLLVMAVPVHIWDGFVLMTIWNWFVPNIFQGAPTLSIVQAIGLGLVVSIFTYRRVATSSKEESALEGALADIYHAVVVGAMSLLMGAIVHSFL